MGSFLCSSCAYEEGYREICRRLREHASANGIVVGPAKRRGEVLMSVVAPDLRGKIYRERRLMQPVETTEYLRRQKVANVGTVDVNGWPYVVPLVMATAEIFIGTKRHTGKSMPIN